MALYDYHTLVDPALSSLEDAHDVTVVGAWAIGARARGTNHSDSDIDVFAVACNEPEALITGRDALYREFETFDEIGPGVDVQIWSLRGVYDGILDDNPTAIHGIDSTYQVTSDSIPSTWDTIESYVLEQANLYALLHHYRSLAKKNYRQYIENENDPTVDRLFFVSDALLRAWYIEELGELPPYDVEDLHQELNYTDDTVGSYVCDLPDRGFVDMTVIKRQGDGDVDYYDVVDDEYTVDVEREIDRDPQEYDADHFGGGVSPSVIDSSLRRIAEQTWRDSNGGMF